MTLAEVRAALGARGLVCRSEARPRVLGRHGLPRQQSPAPWRRRTARPGGTRGPPGAPVNSVLTPPGGGSSPSPGPRPPWPPRLGPARRAPAPGWPPRTRAHHPLRRWPHAARQERPRRAARRPRPRRLRTLPQGGPRPHTAPRRPPRPGPPLPPYGAPGPQEQGERRRPPPLPASRPLRRHSPRTCLHPAPGPPPTGRREHRRRLGARQRPPLTPLLSPRRPHLRQRRGIQPNMIGFCSSACSHSCG